MYISSAEQGAGGFDIPLPRDSKIWAKLKVARFQPNNCPCWGKNHHMKQMWVSCKGKKMALADDSFQMDIVREANFLEGG